MSTVTHMETENPAASAMQCYDGLGWFLKEIGFIPLLTETEEHDLAVLAAAGDSDARNRLVESNIRLAVAVAKAYQAPGIQLQDLIQEGCIGLMKAAERFDVSKNFRFSTYATWWIRQAVTRAISDKGRMIRLPANVEEKKTKLRNMQRRMEQELGRMPTIAELAAGMHCPEKKIKDLISAFPDAISLDTPIGDDEDATLGSFVETDTETQPDEQAIVQLMQQDVRDSLDILTPREAEILRLRYGIDHSHCYTLDEVGAVIGLTRERIRQIEKAAFSKIRHSSYAGTLMAYVS